MHNVLFVLNFDSVSGPSQERKILDSVFGPLLRELRFSKDFKITLELSYQTYYEIASDGGQFGDYDRIVYIEDRNSSQAVSESYDLCLAWNNIGGLKTSRFKKLFVLSDMVLGDHNYYSHISITQLDPKTSKALSLGLGESQLRENKDTFKIILDLKSVQKNRRLRNELTAALSYRASAFDSYSLVYIEGAVDGCYSNLERQIDDFCKTIERRNAVIFFSGRQEKDSYASLLAKISAKYSNFIYDLSCHASLDLLAIFEENSVGILTDNEKLASHALALGKKVSQIGKISDEFSCSDVSRLTDFGKSLLPWKMIEESREHAVALLNSMFKEWGGVERIITQEELLKFYRQNSVTASPYETQYPSSSVDFSIYSEVFEKIFCPQIKCVTFDVFDTLISRKTLTPAGVFLEVERRAFASELGSEFGDSLGASTGDYVTCRRIAEEKARQLIAKLNLKSDINLADIEDQLSQMLNSEDLAKYLIDLEVQVEKDFSEIRKMGMLLYRAAELAGKDIILVSDMYLPVGVISELLQINGYTSYKKLFVSSVYGVHKASGQLFMAVMNEFDWETGDILHIGDNIHGDYHGPRSIGIEARLVESRSAHWLRTYGSVYGVTSPKSLAEELFFGAQARYMFDIPHAVTDNITDGEPLFRGNAGRLGYSVLGPLVAQSCRWIANIVKNSTAKKVLFCARDGFIFYNVFRKLYPELEDKAAYFHVSRRVSLIASISSEVDIRRMCGIWFNNCDVEYLFKYRFGVSIKKLTSDPAIWSRKINYNEDLGFLTSLALELKDYIYRSSARMKGLINSKLKDLGLNSINEAFLFDLGYGGTIQRSLESMSKERFYGGLYFITFKSGRYLDYTRENIHVFTEKNIDPAASNIPFVKAIPIFETLFSHFEGSTVDYIDDGKMVYPVLALEDSNPAKDNFMASLWHGVDSYTTDLGAEDFTNDFTWKDLFKPFDKLIESPSPIDLHMFADCSFENSFSGEPSAPLISSKKEKSWWNFGQNVYDSAPSLLIEKESLRNLLEKDVEDMYVDHIEALYKKHYENKIKELEAKIEGYQAIKDMIHSKKEKANNSAFKLPALKPKWFDEQLYLARHADVADGVKNGYFKSGYDHYVAFGMRESRAIK